MTHPPPPDPLQPDDPTQPYAAPYQPPVDPASGQSFGSPPSWDPRSATPYSSPPADAYPPPPPGYPPTAAFPGYPPGDAYPPTQTYPPTPGYPPGGYGSGEGYPPAGPAPRRGNGGLIAVIAVVALLLCGGVGVTGVLLFNRATEEASRLLDDLPTPGDGPTGQPADPPATTGPARPEQSTADPGAVTVVYEVEGDGTADITYLTGSGLAPTTVEAAPLPWRVEVQMDNALLVTLFAVRTDTASGELTCRVSIDGEEVTERTASGALTVVSCAKFNLGGG